jgi:hypothetical protein
MSTDLYGVRVLELAPGERRARLRVFVVYYDADTDDAGRTTAVHPQPVPDDASFFLRVLWDEGDTRFGGGGPIGDAVTVDQICDESWVDAHTARFVERVRQLAVHNDPPPPESWGRLRSFYYERDGRWADEDLLTRADYDVWVTDPGWLAHLTVGQAWGTTSYDTLAKGFHRVLDTGGLWEARADGSV